MLRRTGTGWQFETEALLEDFFQANLCQLLGLKTLGQQYYINGQVCDLMTVSERGQLSIIELKNDEDRYIVQQLTRYFDAVVNEKPFQEDVDYSQPIRLIAVAPRFHRDNWNDRKYHQLGFEFLGFSIVSRAEEFIFKLQHQEKNETWNAIIPYQNTLRDRKIPSIPKLLLTMLAKSPAIDRQGITSLRETLLSFDARMQEITANGSIFYGKNKNQLCAELKYDGQRGRIALFLWLPHQVRLHRGKSMVARLRLWTNWETVSDLAHVPKAVGRTITIEEWREGNLAPLKKVLPKNKFGQEQYENWPGWKERYIDTRSGALNNAHYKSGIAMTFEIYKKITGQSELSNNFSEILKLALNTWIVRL